MKKLMFLLLLAPACASVPLTHHQANSDPSLVNGRVECPKNHWFNGARCILKENRDR